MFGMELLKQRNPQVIAKADFAEVGTADFSEICLLVSVAGEARAKHYEWIPGLKLDDWRNA